VDDLKVFAGSGSPRLTGAICRRLGIEAGRGELLRFSEGNLFPRILENVRGRDTYIVQTIAYPANDNFMELLFWIDALKRASAESVTVVMPYFSYAKGDKKDEPRVSIRARVCADCIEAAGADRVVTMDLHAAQIQGLFHVPVDDLYALPILCDALRTRAIDDLVVVATDAGFAKKARRYASYLRAPLAIGDKVRTGHDERAEVMGIIGDVRGRSALIVEDFAVSGVTLVGAAERLIEAGATSVRAVLSHAVFTAQAVKLVEDSPLQEVLVTDTVETGPWEPSGKIEVVTVAPLFAEAIKRIHARESVSDLFPEGP
jgi:ribose-phosphate pyrophosphokinase